MQRVSERFNTTYEVKRSSFISYLLPYSHFESVRKTLHAQHPKANHIVWAYRTLNGFGQIIENSTDDGEPKGCAGNPTLAQLRGFEMIESAIITVRYFGGIKLGTGGMVRAYSEAAKTVIVSATLLPYIKRNPFRLTTPYSQVKRYEHFFRQNGIDFGERTFEAQGVAWEMQLSEEEREMVERFSASLL